MQDYASQQRQPSKHLAGLGLVVLLHALLIWAIHSGLAHSVIKKVQAPVQALLLEEPPSSPPPPPTPPRNVPPPPQAHVPPAETPMPTPPQTAAVSAVTSILQPPSPPAAAVVAAPSAPPVRTQAVVNSANCEKPEYPSASRRMEEEGTVSLRFLVGVDGKVIQSEVEKSSGFRRLDEAARAGLAKCQFKPATVDGKPEQAWASMRYTWRLE
jgi:periplasmic protein TonB